MSLRLESLAMPELSGASTGQPLSLPIDAIDEDPEQPRSEFDPVSLQELADTIAARGVRQPISVRPHATVPERWMLNFGARRLRASKLARQATIPAFVDETADSYDQVIENEQRESLKPMELALFVQRRLAAGETQAEVARRLGKSRQYVTYATALIDAPDWLMALYRDGRCRGLKELYDLRRLAETDADAVAKWLPQVRVVARSDVEALRERLSGQAADTAPVTAARARRAVPAADAVVPGGEQTSVRSAAAASAPPAERSVPVVHVVSLLADCDGFMVRVQLDTAPPEPGHVFVDPSDGRPRRSIAIERLAQLRLSTGVIDGASAP
jgi:ParB family chromosome partitioning protein